MAVYFTPEADLLNPCKDGVFKALFTSDDERSRKALKGLLGAILDRQIKDVAIKQNESAIKSERDRQIRFDINCVFDDGNLADIEMTVEPDKAEAKRIEYYESKLHVGQDIKGKDRGYTDLKDTYQISIVCGRLLKGKNFFHKFEFTDEYGEKLNGKMHIIVVELSKLKDIIKKPIEDMTSMESWAVFFRFGADKDKRELVNRIFEKEDAIKMAGATLLTISKEEHMEALKLSQYKYEVDLQSKIVTAKREGMAKGVAKGMAEGTLKERLKIAGNLLGVGMSIEDIAKVTGLDISKIEKLDANLANK